MAPFLVCAMKRVSLIKCHKININTFSSSDEDVTVLIRAVTESDADMVVFVGTSHKKLIELLDAETTVFRFPTVTIMKDVNPNVSLRLDTNIVEVEEGDGYILTETYAVKGQVKNRNVFGTWSESGGLSVESPNVCERRQDLGGVQLRDAIMSYAKLTKLHFDTNENIIGTGGVYQVRRIIIQLI